MWAAEGRWTHWYILAGIITFSGLKIKGHDVYRETQWAGFLILEKLEGSAGDGFDQNMYIDMKILKKNIYFKIHIRFIYVLQ